MTTSHPRLVDSGIMSPQSTFSLSTTQHHPIGTCGRLIGGRVFYYARYSAAATTAAGLVFAAAEPVDTWEDVACGTIAQGARTITGIVGSATAAASGTRHEYQYLPVNDGGTAEGHMFRIESHGTYGTTTTDTITAMIYDELPMAIATGDEVTLMKDPYADVVIAPSNGADRAVGVAHVTMVDSSTTPRYMWLQSYGPCPVFVSSTGTEGMPLVIGTTDGRLIECDQTAAVTITVTPTTKSSALTSKTSDTVTAGRVMAYCMTGSITSTEVAVVDLVIRAS